MLSSRGVVCVKSQKQREAKAYSAQSLCAPIRSQHLRVAVFDAWYILNWCCAAVTAVAFCLAVNSHLLEDIRAGQLVVETAKTASSADVCALSMAKRMCTHRVKRPTALAKGES
jgi:hypothetical protein